MRLVFEKFERSLPIKPGSVSLLRLEDPILFSRCACSLVRGYDDDSPEPAYFFDEANKEIAPSKCLFVVGDILSFDLNDKRIVAMASKKLIEAMIDSLPALEAKSYGLEELFNSQIFQMSGDYALTSEWDTGKYLKMAGFAVDDSNGILPFDKMSHLLRLASDLFPEKVLGTVNLCSYFSQEQFDLFCEQVAAYGLKVLLVETVATIDFSNLENQITVDIFCLES